MVVRLGFRNAAANNIFTDQGIDTLEEVELLTGLGISDLMKTIRSGGHQISYPSNAGDMIYAPGHLISNLAEYNFKLLAYFLRHSVRISRKIPIAEITRQIVRSITDIRDEERNHMDTDTKLSVLIGNWSKLQDAIRECLYRYQGTKKTHLAYVCRDEINPSVEATNTYTN